MAGRMSETWFSGVAGELARCLLDAERAADVAEELLRSLHAREDGALLERVVDAVAAPAAVARVLGDLIDEPPQVVLACVRLLRETAGAGADALDAIAGLEATTAVVALRSCAASSHELLEAAT